MTSMANSTGDLFAALPESVEPNGFIYRENLINLQEEAALVAAIQPLVFKPYEFRGVQARRRVIAFGLQYGNSRFRPEPAAPIPAFLESLRDKAAAFAELPPEDFQQALVSEYSPGTPIGWHKDRDQYDKIVGVSLLSSATLRLRREMNGGWLRKAQILEPRSAYLLAGEVRSQWQHSIPEVAALRYSITFRTMRKT